MILGGKRSAGLLLAAAAVASWSAPAHAVSVLSSTLTVTSAPPAQVRVGDSVVVSGTVTTTVGLIGREVDLERDDSGGATVVDSVTTSPGGSWAFALPTTSAGSTTYRILAPGNLVLAAASSADFTLTVAARPAQLPAPTRTTWQPLGPDDASWSACAPISYRVNAGPLGRYARSLVKRGLAQVQRATGFQFRYLGTTSAVPYTRSRPSGAMLTIAFANARALAGVPSDGGGIGGYDSSGSTIVSGQVVVDSHIVAITRRARGHIPLKLLLHELGHAMGLGHVDNRADRMYPVISAAGPARYGAGDLLGLRAHGVAATARCAGQ